MDAVTGAIQVHGSWMGALALVLVLGVAFYVYSKVNHAGYEKIEDAVKRGIERVKEQAPVMADEVRAEAERLQKRAKELLDSLK